MNSVPKSFYEVFPALKLEGILEGLCQQIQVEKVTSNKMGNRIKVYIVSKKLVQKEQLFCLEKNIKEQLFPRSNVEIVIVERFELSEAYTPKNLFEVYEESILEEFKADSDLEYNLFRMAEITFPHENVMNLKLPAAFVPEMVEQKLKDDLYNIFAHRCGFDVTILLEYETEAKYKKSNNEDFYIEQQIKSLLKNVKKDDEETARQETVKDSGEKKTEEKKPVERKKPLEPLGGRRGGGFGNAPMKRSDNPDVFYGRDFDDETITIDQIVGEIGEVCVRGKILSVETRELRNGEKTIVSFAFTDFTDSIKAKVFLKNEQVKEFCEFINPKAGSFIKLKGVVTHDRFENDLGISSITGIKKIGNFTTSRVDNYPKKRVELHCHTKMSDMDGVTDASALLKRAKSWGMTAMAITDHGCVQAFPEAYHTIGDKDEFKVLYGVEAYIIDDSKDLVVNSKNQSLDGKFVVFDLETTGFSSIQNKIIEIGAVKVEDGKITDRFSTFVNPQVPIPFEIEQLTGIKDEMVMGADTIEVILPQFMQFCEGCVMVAHNAAFDIGFIEENCRRQKIEYDFTVMDTVTLARVLLPALNRYKLDTVAKALGVSLENHHRAVDDAGCTAEIFVKFIAMLKEQGAECLDKVNQIGSASVEAIKKMPTYHAVIIARNETGRRNLYRLVSLSHIDYYARRPRIPKSVYTKYSEGLMIGSACEAGELYQAVLRNAPEEEIIRLVKFYDYLEIQPLGNNAFMLRDPKSGITSEEQLKDINRKICKLGEQWNKPVVATCDVHFMDPEDEVYRRIIMAGKGFADADDQAPLYLRTTEEMLAEFAYLGPEKAEEVVITNTNLVADMCEKVTPIHPDKCPPVIENSDQTLRNICYNKAHEIYGENLPEIVVERLERELKSIIGNGFAVMYIIAQKLVWKSNADGYLVGSRGSVGSSFVATMAGITEVNPLPPHYICPSCHYVDFDSDIVKSYAGKVGCDMEDRDCPVCGQPLKKEGFDIPFETFLGFKGNKEPDIDLNFSGDYQSKAHRYTEVIFGAGQTFRAGTIGTLADKTAFGYVKNYYEERGQHKRVCEIDRIVQGCTGIRRTTGQHPGGIIVLPMGHEIYQFTPVQRPANDMTTDTVTTHFDYHSIDHNLLKLDILGHDDPTMIRMLEDLTGIDAKKIPLDEPKVMSLFRSTEALGIKPEDIGGCPLGSLGIPEFGTDFVIQMLVDTKPSCFSDLIRISGLSHGTDVWLGNAQKLIQEGKATISTAICTRDDIMTYLIRMGLDSELSFTIMESVRKGKGVKPEWEEEMLAHDVPDWYIWSCKTIKYMFPKAHAAAYVMMAYRIAYCKVYHPLAYYAAFFSIRASAFSYEIMCQGRDKLEYYLNDYKKRADTLTKKEQDQIRDMKIVQEMYARGFEFMKIDLYKARAKEFQIIDGKLMPSFASIDGLGDKAADQVVEAAKDGQFLSKDDLRTRAKLSKTIVDLMEELGIIEGLPESNQLSLFDFT